MSFLSDIASFFDGLIGLNGHPQSLSTVQVVARAFLIYLAGYAMLRFGEHRFLGKNSAFDVVLGFIFGTVLSRAINGTGPFFNTIVAGVVLLTLHWLLATATLYSDRISDLVTGTPIPLIRDGEVQKDSLRRSRISEKMLHENLRVRGHCSHPQAVQAAYYEPSGEISVIPKDESSPRVVEVQVEAGVQTVRIELDERRRE